MTASIHILEPRLVVETSPTVYPSITISDQPRTQLNESCTITVMGDLADRHAFAEQLREAAHFFDTWVRPADDELEPADSEAVPA